MGPPEEVWDGEESSESRTFQKMTHVIQMQYTGPGRLEGGGQGAGRDDARERHTQRKDAQTETDVDSEMDSEMLLRSIRPHPCQAGGDSVLPSPAQ